MSRPARRPSLLCVGSTACVLACAAPVAGAQTIADYSRAQRVLLENTMSQAAARSASLPASAPAVAAPAAPSMPAPRTALPPSAPSVQVSGVFASSGGALAEVIVSATAYLLSAGQGVPGTAWRVEAIAVDRVVLSQPGIGAAAGDADGNRKVFPLPALR